MSATHFPTLHALSKDVRLYLISATLVGFTWDGIRAVLFNLYLLHLGYGPESIGLFNAIGALTFSAFCVLGGALGSRSSTPRLLALGVGLIVVGCGLLPLVQFIPAPLHKAWISGTTAVAYLGLALYYVNSLPFLMAATGSAERDQAFSVQVALGPLAAFAGSLVGGLLPQVCADLLKVAPGHPNCFGDPLGLAALLMIPALLALMPIRAGCANHEETHEREPSSRPYRLIALIGLVVTLRLAGRGAIVSFFNVYLDDHLNASSLAIGSMLALGQLVSVPAALVAPRVVRRYRVDRTIVAGSFGMALSMIPLALIPHWGAAGLGFAAASILFAMTTAPMAIYAQELVSLRLRPAMSASIHVGLGLSTALMALGGYAIRFVGYGGVFLGGAALTAAGALVFWLCFCRPRRVAVRRPRTAGTHETGIPPGR
jgi:predicted MFS family arabinose efflux permease